MRRVTIISICFFLLVFTSVSHAETPIGYPWITYGSLSYAFDARAEKGLKLDTYLEQGVDWLKVGNSDFILNTYLGLNITASEHSEDYWNNKIGPRLGVKLKHPISIKDGWGQFAFGVQWEYNSYFGDSKPFSNDSRFVAYFQWGLGGDWKKKQ